MFPRFNLREKGDGWIAYSHNRDIVQLLSHALVSSAVGHAAALEKLNEDILLLKQKSGLSQ